MAYYIIKKVVPKDVPLRRIFFTRSGQQEATWRRTAGGVEDNEEYNRRSGQQEASWRRTAGGVEDSEEYNRRRGQLQRWLIKRAVYTF